MNSKFDNIVGAKIVYSQKGEKFVICSACKRETRLFWLNNVYDKNTVKSYYRCCNCDNYIIVRSEEYKDESN